MNALQHLLSGPVLCSLFNRWDLCVVKHKSKMVNARKLFNLVKGTVVFWIQCIWLENGPQIATKLIIEVKHVNFFLASHDYSECKQSNLSECMTDVTQCELHLLQKSFHFILRGKHPRFNDYILAFSACNSYKTQTGQELFFYYWEMGTGLFLSEVRHKSETLIWKKFIFLPVAKWQNSVFQTKKC